MYTCIDANIVHKHLFAQSLNPWIYACMYVRMHVCIMHAYFHAI